MKQNYEKTKQKCEKKIQRDRNRYIELNKEFCAAVIELEIINENLSRETRSKTIGAFWNSKFQTINIGKKHSRSAEHDHTSEHVSEHESEHENKSENKSDNKHKKKKI